MQPLVPVVGFVAVDSVLREPRRRMPDGIAAAFSALAAEGVSIVFCSGGTRAELERVQQDCRIRQPFICEDGSAVFVPSGYFSRAVPHARAVPGYQVIEFGPAYATVVETLRRVARRLNVSVRGFSNMSIEEVAVAQGVPLLEARLATLREYGEVFRIDDDRPAVRNRLRTALQSAHLRCVSRRGVDHVRPPVDIGEAAVVVRSIFERELGPVATFAVADAESDPTLLDVVDHAVRVNTPGGGLHPSLTHGKRSRVVDASDLMELAGAMADAVRQIRTAAVH